jgi:hypothetical protein
MPDNEPGRAHGVLGQIFEGLEPRLYRFRLLQKSRRVFIGSRLIVFERAQKSEDPRASFRCGARSRIGHVGKSWINKSKKGRIEPEYAPEGQRASTYFIARAGSMNFFTTKAL